MASSSQIQGTTSLDETQEIRGAIGKWIKYIDEAVDQLEYRRSSGENASSPIEALTEQLNNLNPALKDLVDQVEKATTAASCCGLHGANRSHSEVLRVTSEILRNAGTVHWVLAGATIAGFILQRVVEMKENEEECVKVLKDLQSFSKYLYEFEMQREVADSSKLDEVRKATAVMVEGAVVCEDILKPGWRCGRWVGRFAAF